MSPRLHTRRSSLWAFLQLHSQTVFTQADIWCNQQTHSKPHTLRQCQTSEWYNWEKNVRVTVGQKNGSDLSYIFIQIGLLQVNQFKLNPLQDLFQWLACFVIQLFTWRKSQKKKKKRYIYIYKIISQNTSFCKSPICLCFWPLCASYL